MCLPMNTKIEEFVNGLKLGEKLHKNEIEEEKNKNCVLKGCIIVLAAVLLIVATAFTVYKLTQKDYDDFDDFDDDFDDDFMFDDDSEETEDDNEASEE